MKKSSFMVITTLFILSASIFVSCPGEAADYKSQVASSSAPETKSRYVETIFATPTQQEIETALEELSYEPKCEDFAIGDVYDEIHGRAFHYVTYTSDALKQTGLFAFPDGDGPHKLLVMNHSGLNGIPPFEIFQIEKFIKNDYAIIMATYRGEEGAAGPAEGAQDLFGNEMHDILDLMECAVQHEKTDPARIAMMGISHGGGLTALSLTQLDNVKAAGMISAPTNLIADPIKSMAYTWKKQPARIEAPLQILLSQEAIIKLKDIIGLSDRNPKRIPEFRRELIRRSPTFFADRINTPLIIFYGGQDPVSFPEDGERIVASLRARGLDAELTVFDDQSHGLAKEKADIAFNAIFNFLDSRIDGE